MTHRALPSQQLFGTLALVGVLLAAVALVLSPAVARPTARVAATLASAFDAERADDLVITLPSLDGIQRGLPVYYLPESPEAEPIAHVTDFGDGADGPFVRLRFEPGAASAGPWQLESYPPSRKLKAAFEMVVTKEAASRFGREMAKRLERLWAEAILPETRKRLPAFLERIDPSKDTQSKVVLRAFSKSVMDELEPLLDDLAAHVTRAVKKKFDVLDRLGMLWKVVRGDDKGLKDAILPVAKAAARAWWTEHEAEIMKALGRAFSAHADEFKAWASGELFDAAREELVMPILVAQGERLESEGEFLLRRAAKEFVEAPEGGLRVRFANVLRTQLLNKKTALLLLERPAGPR